ncbi:hypothetical protein VIGAN_02243000 [Vigna angularis var. angularis]|uniref:Bifunctional inhibitor/plant lipid transfer protein/seed storage helical domain-containing protein n=1 Tax=Vigna angularis var. angularis TaxID=157739 RepID=A0A0S3RG46_PHAAN|nr:hypothetical protein VIGAN_02243000 [Vigna angularis var. angularis]
MGEKKVLAVMMFVMAYGLAVTRLSYSQIPATCSGDEKLLSFCGQYLVNNTPNPSSDCCNSASAAFKRAMASGQVQRGAFTAVDFHYTSRFMNRGIFSRDSKSDTLCRGSNRGI